MSGPEHFRKSEHLMAEANREVVNHADAPWGPVIADAHPVEIRALMMAEALVHATLAQAAATAMQNAGVPADGPTARAWREAIVPCEVIAL